MIPTVAYGGYFLSAILKRNKIGINFTDYPYAQRLFKAGHAHAGVWLVLSLVALNFIQHTHLSGLWQAILRYSFPLPALITSASFFGGAFPLDTKRNTPSKLFCLVYICALLLGTSCLLLSFGLFTA